MSKHKSIGISRTLEVYRRRADVASVFVTTREGQTHLLEAQPGLFGEGIIRDAGISELLAFRRSCSCATCHVYVDPESRVRLSQCRKMRRFAGCASYREHNSRLFRARFVSDALRIKVTDCTGLDRRRSSTLRKPERVGGDTSRPGRTVAQARAWMKGPCQIV